MNLDINEPDNQDFKRDLFRYLSFWPYFLLSTIISFSIIYLTLRYTDDVYETNSSVQIIDDAMDSDMALPTAMTIFNRSTVNLENEIEVLTSYKLLSNVIKDLKYNISFYAVGRIREPLIAPEDWLENLDYKFNYLESLDDISFTTTYSIFIDQNGLEITNLNNEDKFLFENFNTNSITTDLPFELIIDPKGIENNFGKYYKIVIKPVKSSYFEVRKNLSILKIGDLSHILKLSFRTKNKKLSEALLNKIILDFDLDGIKDRQLVFKRTIDFVDSRFSLLSSELDSIEVNLEEFKKNNDLTYIEADASISKNQMVNYNSELFQIETQLDLVEMLKESLSFESFDYIPVNIGINEDNLNQIIIEYNTLLSQRDNLVTDAGENSPILLNNQNQLNKLSSNIITSINNYSNLLKLKLKNLLTKETEFGGEVSGLPENERILRSIKREQEIKEALFLLLLQKREEASINYAVTKPSLKVIDYAMSSTFPVYPNHFLFYLLAILFGLLVPFTFLFIWFFIDNKIHTRKDIPPFLADTPVIGEIPFVKSISANSISSPSDRSPIGESIRMITANLNFVLFDKKKNPENNVILVTSSIKGEGKTLVSTNTASILSAKYDRVLLLGADLRNPQIHKYIGLEKTVKGLSDYIYSNTDDYKSYIHKYKNFDIMLSGTIPPNPTELLSSEKFSSLINTLKNNYDFIIIDSAPCILVSDTFEISKLADLSIYVLRSNFSEKKLFDFIYECKKMDKIKNLNLVLNGVGNSQAYGYKYGYQYGYNYSYNYGYGYGYGEDK